MAGEDIQVERGKNSITNAVLLDEESRIGAGQWCMPGSPLIHRQGHLLLRIVLIHDGFLLAQELIHERASI